MKPWIEKYRPSKISDVYAQSHVCSVLEKTKNNLPHLLFYGPPGTGKTSLILALSKELTKSAVLELNASDERGIDVVRTKIKNFAKKVFDFKIIILDEADSMTHEAQSALRRIMEKYSSNTRFCLICNYPSRIIDPIASRCAKFRFHPLNTKEATQKLREICILEQITATDEVLDYICLISKGDLRKSIMYLQSSSKMQMTKETIDQVCGIVPHNYINDIIQLWLEPCFDKAMNLAMEIKMNGFSVLQICRQLFESMVDNIELQDSIKSRKAMQLAVVESRLLIGCDEQLQLLLILQ